MKLKSCLPMILLFFIALPFTSAALGYNGESLGIFKQGTAINIPQTCENCSYINITTMSYPNSTSISPTDTREASMTNLTNKNDYSYSLTSTKALGIYLVHFKTSEDGKNIATANAWFEVTPTGYKQTTAEGIGSMVYLFLVIFMTALLLFVGFKLSETEMLWVLGVFFMFLSLLMMLYDLWLGYEYQLKYVGYAGSVAIPETLFYLFLFSVVAGLLVGGVLLFKKLPEVINWFKVNVKGESEDGWDGGKKE